MCPFPRAPRFKTGETKTKQIQITEFVWGGLPIRSLIPPSRVHFPTVEVHARSTDAMQRSALAELGSRFRSGALGSVPGGRPQHRAKREPHWRSALAVAFGALCKRSGRCASVGQVGRASDQAEGQHRRSAPPPGSISSGLDGTPTTEGFITTPLGGNPNNFRFVFAGLGSGGVSSFVVIPLKAFKFCSVKFF